MRAPRWTRAWPAPSEPTRRPDRPHERALLARFADAFARGDRAGLLALMSADVRLRVPPDPAEHHGRAAAARFLAGVPFGRDPPRPDAGATPIPRSR